ncbi:E3 ubiquitin/ISG15 ligase TRIM25 [Fundulus heteroclitus]|uniref:E3 ubiquitin/ISG15 ligase TRIM25 n=1 Tax=Fundulus heteroclitus TaxID=8078 RepID=UPI00165B4E0D|nr:E3 ubiquitin/ISG15 ligase TRIM25 [Fundulus heteroclitus]
MSKKLWTEEQFNCPVCLDLPKDPVTIPCGHSYCMGCIKDFWSKDDPKGVYSCPQCRQTFCPKPPLSRNTMLAEAVEQLRKGGLTPEMRDSIRSAGGLSSRIKSKLPTGVVLCDLCKGEQTPALRSCLVCMSSLCETHLKPHKTKKSLKQHELIAPTSNLAEKICTQHKYLQEFFCRQCKMFVCWLCTSNQHKDHECVSTKAERMEREKLLSTIQAQNQQRLKAREQELKDMKKMMEGIKRSTDNVHRETETALGELQRSVERLQELLEEVLDQASMEKMNQAQEVADKLEAEIQERRKRDTEMKDLASCEDNIFYLQTCDSMSSPLECGDQPPVKVNVDATFEPVLEAVLALRNRVEDLCNQELGNITKREFHVVLNEHLWNRFHDPDGRLFFFFLVFSALGNRTTNHRSTSPNISVARRSADQQGLRGPDVRSRDSPRDRGNGSSPRVGNRRRREERETEPETNPSPSSAQSLWSRSSQNPVAAPAAAITPIPATPAPAPVPVPVPVPVPTPAPSNAFSRMPSITSLFRSTRRGAKQATPAGGNPWGMDAVSETPTEINPGLFLDTPLPGAMTQAPAFPALREINIDSIQAPEPRTREEFLQYSVSLTLDPNTAHRRLVLSEGNTKATLQGPTQSYADTPQRFDGWTQVMCQSPLQTQRSYWEVEWRGRGSSMGVAYGALSRKGSDARSGLGYNAQSWSLELSDTCCLAMHDNEKRDIPVTYSPRLGIYVDLSVGMLSFYSVADNMTHLHSFRANFTQPIYATFGVGSGVGVGLDFALGQFTSSSDSIKICPL